jgi:proline iminopeptidase
MLSLPLPTTPEVAPPAAHRQRAPPKKSRVSPANRAANSPLKIGDASPFVDVIGQGYPLLLMHGGPSLDHWSLAPFRQCADQFTVIFYDHRCNGRSKGAPVSSMTFENLTADAEALREKLGRAG